MDASGMDKTIFINQEVVVRKTGQKGTLIRFKDDNKVVVHFSDGDSTYRFPERFADILQFRDNRIQEQIGIVALKEVFEDLISSYSLLIQNEIDYIKRLGGKNYKVFEGERITDKKRGYTYSFDLDAEVHIPEGTEIRIYYNGDYITGHVLECEDFSIVIKSDHYLGDYIEELEFQADSWFLLEMLKDRLTELSVDNAPLAAILACTGKGRVNEHERIARGQKNAVLASNVQPITFIWGPPGTGKTTTLANIALDGIRDGKRVLMISYSNVSVDSALLKVAELAGEEYISKGQILRYGYPRNQQLLANDYLISYQYALSSNKELQQRQKELIRQRRKTERGTSEALEISKKLNNIRNMIRAKEKRIIQRSSFVATTVSKAVSDAAIYRQRFDIVLFDEASMAYIPQVIYAASLAKSNFVCLGDFKQLPAIVQDPNNIALSKDIFEFTGITGAVDNGYSHEWLVMLDTQYRMHKTIADFVSKHMYNDLLRTYAESDYMQSRIDMANNAPNPGNAMSIVDLSGTYSVCQKSSEKSRINLLSAMICVKIAETMADRFSVGIITPYNAQARLIRAMLRDLQVGNNMYTRIKSSTVHQFQGSEEDVIIYDTVDCFRMSYISGMLTSTQNDQADRLFNVALTRARGKFILVTNLDYLKRKKLSKDRLLMKLINTLEADYHVLKGRRIVDVLNQSAGSDIYLASRDSVEKQEYYAEDLSNAYNKIDIDALKTVGDRKKTYESAQNAINRSLRRAIKKRVLLTERFDRGVSIPQYLAVDSNCYPSYILTPATVIDNDVVWYGEPLCNADFISEDQIIQTDNHLSIRMEGRYTARSVRTFLKMKKNNVKEKSVFERLIDKRKIRYLIHFTRVENLPSIFQNGLLPRDALRDSGIAAVVNDPSRKDNTDAVCVSISFPNYKLFYRYRMKRPDTRWAVLLLDPMILDYYNCSFASQNAASNKMSSRSSEVSYSVDALHAMFIETKDGNVRHAMNLDTYETTDPQAEILFHERIDPRYIKKVIVQSLDDIEIIDHDLSVVSKKKITTEYKDRYYSERRQEYRSYFEKRADYQYWR